MHMVTISGGKLLPYLEQSVADHDDPQAQELLARDMLAAMKKNADAYGLDEYEIRTVTPEEYRELQAIIGADENEVRAHAGGLINRRYPVHVQLNALAAGGDPEMTAYINAVRAASNEIGAQEIIPLDFASDERWPK